MTEVDGTPILEHLKGIQDRLSRMDASLKALQGDMRGIKGHMASFMAAEAAQDLTIATLSERVDRIEARLGLRDEA